MIEPQFENQCSPSEYDWLEKFRQQHGRSPRVLHIGNIANNAYNNAKLLNDVGLDCDVICYDYYHIMGCPEWEDADFVETVRDQFFPNWHSVNLNGFQRPRWFVQGPIKLCIRYLLAKRQNDFKSANFLWLKLELYRYAITCLIGSFLYFLYRKLKTYVKYFKAKITLLITKIYTLLSPQKYSPLHESSKSFDARIEEIIQPPQKYSPLHKSSKLFDARIEEVIQLFHLKFPERTDRLLVSDLTDYRRLIVWWTELFEQYDIIQGYSTDPIWPLLAGKKYFAFEHGTLREIPFHNTTQGRITAISYSEAQHVFVTNSDCLENAHYLAGERVSYLNHPYDENHGVAVSGWQELRQQLCQQLNADFLFFFPTRQDWVIGTGYADKSNDVFLKAFCRLRLLGHKVGMVCCRWGKNVQDSIHFLQENQCADYVLWQEPMGTVQFERTVKACHVVVDQFKLGSFGGVMFKAMAVGAPICTYLNEAEILRQYDRSPPVLNCQTDVQIVQAIEEAIACPERLHHLSQSAKQWIDKYHSSKSTVQTQLQQYKLLLMTD
ncbi:Glycosyl transferase group 1 [Tumidithrix helvetica PCC 7403]|uniref:glycosyltransferase n=1 Tax=Tumidithrix helvetica TaxID=3457545 RepID=UPI003C9E45E3